MTELCDKSETYFYFTKVDPKVQKDGLTRLARVCTSIKSAGIWLPSSGSCPWATLPLPGPERGLGGASPSTLLGRLQPKERKPRSMTSSFLMPPPFFFFMPKLFPVNGYAGDLEKVGTQLCFPCPAPDVGCGNLGYPLSHHSFFRGQSYGPRERPVPPE